MVRDLFDPVGFYLANTVSLFLLFMISSDHIG